MSDANKKIKAVFFEIEKEERNYVKRALKEFDVVFIKEPLTEGTLDNYSKELEGVEVLSVFVHSMVTSKVIEALPKLRLIVTRSTGYDHIDLQKSSEKDIVVSNVPAYGEATVAEHTFALILALSRNIHKAQMKALRNDFSFNELQGFDLNDKTIGVVGAGRIGLHVIRIAKGFGMHVLVYDVKKDPFLSEILRFKYVSLEDLLKHSDIISLHAPYNKHTHHLINKDNINLIKKGAVLVNTSRGALVDTEALTDALDKKILRGAGLDVFEGENLLNEDIELLKKGSCQDIVTALRAQALLHRDDVVVTPHIAFNSKEANQRILDVTFENIMDFLAGRPSNKVNA